MIIEKEKDNVDKVFGFLRKLTLDKTTHTLKKLNSKGEEKNNTLLNDYYFELNLYETTLTYKNKSSDNTFKRSYGYKQVLKYTLRLTKEEEALAQGQFKLGFKLFLENKTILLFCKSIFDLRMWIEGFKKFFDKKEEIMRMLQIKLKGKIQNPRYFIEQWKYLEKYLMSFSDSFIFDHHNYSTESNLMIEYIKNNIKETHIKKRRYHSVDKLFIRSKTSSSIKTFKYYNQICNPGTLIYKSKILKRDNNTLIYSPDKFMKIKSKNDNRDSSTLQLFIDNLINQHSTFFRMKILKYLTNKLKENYKFIREQKILSHFSTCKREMDDEYDFFMKDNENYSSTQKISRSILKNQVGLLHSNNRIEVINIGNENNEEITYSYFVNNSEEMEHSKIIYNQNNSDQKTNSEDLNNNDKNKDIKSSLLQNNDNKSVEINISKNEKVSFKEDVSFLSEGENQNESRQDPFNNFAHSIDNRHYKPNISLNITTEHLQTDIFSYKDKKALSVVESPHFDNIAIIAQRYNKIDNIDDWKDYIDL